MVTSVFAMNAAIEKARKTGIAYVGVHNSCHFGAAGYYVNLAAKADMIGLAMANDTPSMVTPGARKPVLGHESVFLRRARRPGEPDLPGHRIDAVAIGKIRIAKALGQKVPDTWLVDPDGAADDRRLRFSTRGRAGAVRRPQGIRHRLDDRSAGGLAGRWRHPLGHHQLDRRRTRLPTNHGGAFLAIDVGQIVPLQAFKNRVDAMIRDIRETPQAKGVDRVRVPGEIEWEKRRAALADGIPLPEDVRTSLQTAAAAVGLTADWLSQ